MLLVDLAAQWRSRLIIASIAYLIFSSDVFAATQCSDPSRKPTSQEESTLEDCQYPLAVKSGKKFTLKEHVEASLARSAEVFGVSALVLSNFFEALGSEASTTSSRSVIENCFKNFSDGVSSRDSLLNCLRPQGRGALGNDLFELVNSLRIPRLRNPKALHEEQRTLALMAYLQDLIRESQKSDKSQAAWYDNRSKTFLDDSSTTAFPYKTGDLVLTLGDSSVSSIISQCTFPIRKYSHALIMGRTADQSIEVYETLIETGSILQTQESFSKRALNSILVLRWKDASSGVPEKAGAMAREMALAKIPYDPSMDFSEDEKLFCSEFVLKSFSKVSGVPLKDLNLGTSTIRSDRVFAYLQQLGVNQRNFPSPGDLLSSPYFEIVAEYRNDRDLIYLWGMMAMADVWMERLDQGFRLHRTMMSRIKSRIGAMTDLVGGLIGTDWNLLPESLSPAAAATIMTQEESFKLAYNAAIKTLSQKFSERSLLEIPLWEIRGHLSYALQEDAKLRIRFRP